MATAIDAESHEISEEIELLQEIYVHEIELSGLDKRPIVVSLFLHPSTGDDDHNSKYVCLNLCLSIPGEYPFQSPSISIRNPRGLSDAHLISIQENLIALAKEKIGSPMLYDLIEYTKECLSDNNIPSCPCVICLEHFGKEEKFVKTECYHYFHSVCLANYVEHFLSENHDNKKIVCPMCRLDIVYDKSNNENENSSKCNEEMFVFKPDEEQLKAQAERQRMFEYQKSKGGIINVEEEKNKYLIGIKSKKDEESKNSDLQSEEISAPVAPGMFGKTGVSQSGVSSQSTDQTCQEKITDKGKRNKDKRCCQETGNQSSGQASGRGKREKRRDTEGQTRMQLSVRGGDCGMNCSNLAGETKKPGFCKENKRNEVGIRKNNESHKEKPQKRTGCETNRGSDEPGTQRKSKNSYSISDGEERNLEKTRESRDQNEEHKKQSAKDEIPLNWRGRDGGSLEGEQETSKEQANDLKDRDWTKDHENEKDMKSKKTTLKPQTKNFKEAKKHTENEGSNVNNINNNSTSRQTIKQTNRKQKHRKSPTPRKSREDEKDCNASVERTQKSDSSITSGISDPEGSAKKIEEISKMNYSFSFQRRKKASKNRDANCSKIRVEKTSSNDCANVVNNMHSDDRSQRDHRKPPGFENERSDKTVDKHLETAHFGGLTSQSGLVRKPARAPPGFENIKPISKRL